MKQLLNRRFLIILSIVVTLGGGWFLYKNISGAGTVDPNTDKNRTAEEGRDYAALYRQGGVFMAVDSSEPVMSQIRNNVLTFARTTRPEFASKDTLVGFTFDKKSTTNGDTSVFTGRYYGLRDKIEIKLTPNGRGIYTLSITNLKDNTNVDSQLSMNGKRNHYITTLPVEKQTYSIRYQNNYDRVLVTFYDGYAAQDVDEAVNAITEGLGEEADKNVMYNINRLGIVPLQTVRDNLINPLPRP